MEPKRQRESTETVIISYICPNSFFVCWLRFLWCYQPAKTDMLPPKLGQVEHVTFH